MRLERQISTFLEQFLDFSKPVLLGISGGPDSLALLYLLLEYQKQIPFQLALAHVDHGWRSESSSEAEQLRQLALQLQLPFFLRTLSPEGMKGNLEAACREERLNFFRELLAIHQFQAVLLAHHADDQAETVLKRLLEGADLSSMTSLQGINKVNGVPLWRPLLGISKREILQWLKQRNFSAFNDSTNLDPKFLRGRFRTQIIPHLTKMFGKEVSGSLCHIGNEVQELKAYLTERVQHHLMRIETGRFGSFLDLSKDRPEVLFELKFLLRQLLKQNEILLSRSLIDSACELIVSGKANRQLSNMLYIDRRRIFIFKTVLERLPSLMSLQVGTYPYGPWQVTVKSCQVPMEGISSNWKSAWDGKVEVVLPEAHYHLGPANQNAPYPGMTASIDKWWGNSKVPAIFRHWVPVIWQGDKIVHEFLTGRLQHHFSDNGKSWLHISLEIISY